MTAQYLHRRSFLQELFSRKGIRPLTSLGQNFLVDANLMAFLVNAAQIRPEEVALEIGSGTGALTKLLAEKARHVVAIEMDRKLHELTCEAVASLSNVTVVYGDALGQKTRLSRALIDAVLAQRPASVQLVANLPYCVAAPVIMGALESPLPIRQIVVTVQREIADRLSATPGSASYGFLTVMAKNIARVDVLRRLGPQVFWPRPKVHSSIVRIVPHGELSAEEYVALRALARALFQSRRKTLRNALRSLPPEWRRAAESEEFTATAGVDFSVRGETLSPLQVLQLARKLADCKLTNEG